MNEALKKIKDEGYTHREKSDNILIKYTDTNRNDFYIKLTDFGFSTNKIFQP